MDVLAQIANERSAKEELSKIFPAELLDREYDRLLERRRQNTLRTAETAMIVIKEIHPNGPFSIL